MLTEVTAPPFAKALSSPPTLPKVIKIILGAPGSSGGGTVTVAAVAYDSIAALRLTTTTYVNGDLVQVKSWHAGLRLGGGDFQYDAADTTRPDDSGLTIVDALGRRWKRLLPDGRISPTMWGAKADPINVDDSVAINAMFDAIRASLTVATGMAALHVDAPALTFGARQSINASGIATSSVNCSLGELAIVAKADPASPFAPAFDLGDSKFYDISNLVVSGDTSNPPYIGIMQARKDGGVFPHPTADRGNIRSIACFGRFGAVGLLNLAAETYHYGFVRTSNTSIDPRACCRMFIGSSAIFFNRFGRNPESKFYTVGLDSGISGQSLSSTSISHTIDQRTPAYNLIITISKANPAVGTFANTTDQATAVANGFGNGATVHLTTVGDGAAGWDSKSALVWTIANFNSTTRTFQFVGLDTSAIADNLTSASLRNNTGPSVVLGHLGQYIEHNGYITAYARSKVLLDTRTGPDHDKNWQINLRARHELGTAYLIEILGDDQVRDVRGLHIHTDNENSRVAPIRITDASGGGGLVGRVRLSDFVYRGGHNGQSPAEYFDVEAPGYLDILGGDVVGLLSGATPTAEPDQNDFGEGVFDFTAVGGLPRVKYYGERAWKNRVTFSRATSNAVAARMECTEDSAVQGPFVDVARTRGGNGGHASDILGAQRYLGEDSLGNETAYVIVRASIKASTDGLEDGQYDWLFAANGVFNTRAASMNRFGLQGGVGVGSTSMTNADVAINALSNSMQQFDLATLTADRKCTLNVLGIFAGCRFRISRTGGGAFNRNVWNSTANLIKPLATGQWGDFIYDGTNWMLAAFGPL